MRKSFKIGLAL